MNTRLETFQHNLQTQADLAFLPISSDLQYLIGIPREFPHFGAVHYPGMWLEGVWIAPGKAPIFTMPRMTATFHGMADLDAELRILGDHDDPFVLLKAVLAELGVPARPRIAITDRARADTLIALKALYADYVLLSATAMINQQRRIKDDGEIEMMRQSGAMTEAAFQDVLGVLKHGMTELDIISEVDYRLKQHGSLGPSFSTAMYNSGPDHELIFGHSHEHWHRFLNPPVSLLFDFGAIYHGYCYDFGRTVFFGEPSAEMQRIYELVMASQQAGIAALKVGHTTSQTDAAARQVIEEGGYAEAFRHRLGHGIGLDVHEAPFLTASDHTPLEEGMTFTIEPSITQFDSFSARVEDVVMVGPDGGIPLTSGFQSLIVVE